MDSRRLQELRSGKLNRSEVTSDDIFELIALQLEADPLYRMSESTFRRLAESGRFPADPRTDIEVVRAVADGHKPAAIIDEFADQASRDDSAVRLSVNRGLTVRYFLRTTAYSETVHKYERTFIVAADPGALEKIHRANLIPEPAGSVMLGRALGYAEADIACFLMRNYDGRPRGKELVHALRSNFEQDGQPGPEWIPGWQDYNPPTTNERFTGDFAPPAPDPVRLADVALDGLRGSQLTNAPLLF